MLIRYYGHVGDMTGYGAAGRELCMAVLAAGFRLEITSSGAGFYGYADLAPLVVQEHEMTPDPDVVIIHTLPLDCGKLLDVARIRDLYPRSLCVAYTTWEAWSPISTVVAAELGKFDMVWVPCFANQRAVRTGLASAHRDGTECVVIPHAFDEAWLTGTVNSSLQSLIRVVRAEAQLVSAYRFLYIGAWNRRKNVEGLIRAYARAFAKRDEVRLHIHSVGADPSWVHAARLATGVPLDDQAAITFTNEKLEPSVIEHMYPKIDCFVSASCGEAWNLPAFDALRWRRHIIVPRDHGSDDFLEGTSAVMYRSRLSPCTGEIRIETTEGAPPGHAAARYYGCQGVSSRDDWPAPDEAQLAIDMRRAYIERITELRVDYDVGRRFGRARVGELIRRCLEKAMRA